MEGDIKTTILMSPKTHSQLKAIAKASRLSMSRVIEYALKAYITRVTDKSR